MKREEDQELWDLLGRAGKQAELSPFFARNVVRQIRTEAEPRESAWGWLRPAILIPSTAVAITMLAAAVTLQSPARVASVAAEPMPELIAELDPQDFQVVADLDLLIAWEEEVLWDDT